MRRKPAVAVLAVLSLLTLPAAALADDSFWPEGDDHLFAAGGDRVLSTVDDAEGRTRLQEGFGDQARALGVRPVSPRVGIDVGTDAAGGAVAVYGRCPRGRGCDLYAFSFTERRERRIGVARGACSEVGPRIDRGTIVFQRFQRRSRKRALRCKRGLFEKRPGQRLRRVMRRPPDDYDYADGMLAIQRSLMPDARGREAEPTTDEIRILEIGNGPSRLIARSEGVVHRSDGALEGTFVSMPTLSGGLVYWIRSVEDLSTGDRITTADVSRTPVAGEGPFTVLDRTERLYVGERSGGGDDLFAIAVDGEQLLYAFAKGIGRVSPGPPPFQ